MNVAGLLALPAMIAPDSQVLIDGVDLDGAPLTYQELQDRVARAAGMLSGLGVVPGQRVALVAANSGAAVEVVMATCSLGATVVPINFRASAQELDDLVRHAEPCLVVCDTRYYATVRGLTDVPVIDLLSDDPGGYNSLAAVADPISDVAEVDERSLAVLLYTSGTTSRPKAVPLSHGALTRRVIEGHDIADGTDRGRFLLAVPLYHIAGLSALLNCVYSGRTVVTMPQFGVVSWFEAVARRRVTHAFLVPTMLAQLVDSGELHRHDLSSLQVVTYGAAPMPPGLIARVIDQFPLTTDFAGAYGQTETASTIAVLDVDDHRLDDPLKVRRLSSVGKVLEDVQVRIVDPEGQPAGAGVCGEVHVRGSRVIDGYWQPGTTESSVQDEDGWLATGDKGYLDDGGYLFLNGRVDDVIIRGGENVAPAEVEAVLFDHPAVLDAAVVGLDDAVWGQRVVAAVILGGGTARDVMDYASRRLSPFKRPSEVHVLDVLPRNSTGKLVRRELRARLAAHEADASEEER